MRIGACGVPDRVSRPPNEMMDTKPLLSLASSRCRPPGLDRSSFAPAST
jgi:hypothetical protein